jgi:hypothetical protein
MKKYLRITLYDNDFSTDLKDLGGVLLNYFDLQIIKKEYLLSELFKNAVVQSLSAITKNNLIWRCFTSEVFSVNRKSPLPAEISFSGYQNDGDYSDYISSRLIIDLLDEKEKDDLFSNCEHLVIDLFNNEAYII